MKKQVFLFFLTVAATAFSSLESCSNCSRSGNKRRRQAKTEEPYQPSDDRLANNPDDRSNRRKPTLRSSGKRTVVKMTQRGGVYEIPIKINGLELDFIIDTGASSISISQAEAVTMQRQGKIDESDIIGERQFSDANGDISVGMVIRLRSVQIGDRELQNVEASVVNNIKAPLLLGQSALAQFGKISIDYNRQEISFE